MRIEKAILSNLIHNEEYTRKVLPFVKTEYFGDRKEHIIAEEIKTFFDKYNKPITLEILAIELGNRNDINDKEVKEFNELVVR